MAKRTPDPLPEEHATPENLAANGPGLRKWEVMVDVGGAPVVVEAERMYVSPHGLSFMIDNDVIDAFANGVWLRVRKAPDEVPE